MRACVPVLLLALSSAAAFAEPSNAEVADPNNAAAMVAQVAGDAIATLNSKLDHARAHARLRSELAENFNLRYVGLLALGPYRRDMADADLESFEAAFGDYVLARYASLLENRGAKAFRITGAERAGSRDALVHMVIDGEGAPVEADWRVRMFSGAAQIIDLSVGGVSIAQLQQDEVGAAIKELGVAGFIAHMRDVASRDGA